MQIIRRPIALIVSLVIGFIGVVLIMVFYYQYNKKQKNSSNANPQKGLCVAGLILIGLMMLHFVIYSTQSLMKPKF